MFALVTSTIGNGGPGEGGGGGGIPAPSAGGGAAGDGGWAPGAPGGGGGGGYGGGNGGGNGSPFGQPGAAGAGGGGALVGPATSIASSILAASTTALGAAGPDCRGVVAAGAANLVQAPLGCTRSAGDVLSGDPLLDPPADNGGPTPTMAPRPGSPVVDQGADPLGLGADQRGAGYPRVIGAAADVGAFEYGQGTLNVRVVVQPAGDPGRFDVLADDTPFVTAGGGGASGTVTRPIGPVTMSEAAADLADFDVSVDCGTGAVAATSYGVTLGTAPVACTFTNVRRAGPAPDTPATPSSGGSTSPSAGTSPAATPVPSPAKPAAATPAPAKRRTTTLAPRPSASRARPRTSTPTASLSESLPAPSSPDSPAAAAPSPRPAGTKATPDAPAPPPARPREETAAQPKPAAASAHRADDRSWTADSFLTNSTVSPADIRRAPERIAEALGYGLVWILALVCMARLLDETLKHRYGVWSSALRRRLPGAAARVGALGRRLDGGRPGPMVAILAANIVIMALVEPRFGFHGEALRLLGSIALATTVTTVCVRYLASLGARRLWRTRTTMRASGWALTVALLGMGLSRALQFVPGLLHGSTMELRPDSPVSPREMARVQTLRAWLSLVAAGLGWAGAALVTPEPTVPALLVHDALVAIAVGSLSSLLVDLLPLPALIGGMLWSNARRQWTALTLATATGFAMVVLPQSSNWMEVEGVGRWVTITVAFMVVALLAVLEVNRRIRREHVAGAPELEVD